MRYDFVCTLYNLCRNETTIFEFVEISHEGQGEIFDKSCDIYHQMKLKHRINIELHISFIKIGCEMLKNKVTYAMKAIVCWYGC